DTRGCPALAQTDDLTGARRQIGERERTVGAHVGFELAHHRRVSRRAFADLQIDLHVSVDDGSRDDVVESPLQATAGEELEMELLLLARRDVEERRFAEAAAVLGIFAAQVDTVMSQRNGRARESTVLDRKPRVPFDLRLPRQVRRDIADDLRRIVEPTGDDEERALIE